ncbi:hypothetical protein [Amycolatopsis sp. MtRt-6]|uniref:hypothetical protein n=1 Tax=Amycolatopsis sp. MtRt-6 TaxID=2792782 RepID=UPI001F5E2F8B|nr:hypothetical protein [Amycolatopsis sp. MtRt-6]
MLDRVLDLRKQLVDDRAGTVDRDDPRDQVGPGEGQFGGEEAADTRPDDGGFHFELVDHLHEVGGDLGDGVAVGGGGRSGRTRASRA